MHDNSMHSTELSRLLHNLLRFGTIAAVDHQRAQCHVKAGELTTDWLNWFTLATGRTRTWQAPTLGEQVLLLSPGGELSTGVVLFELYCDSYPASSDQASLHLMQYPDGAVLAYDHTQHTLQVNLPDGGAITLATPGTITLNAPHTVCTSHLTEQGQLSYAGGLVGKGGEGARIEGSLHASGDIQAGGVSLTHHRHGGVEAGGSPVRGAAMKGMHPRTGRTLTGYAHLIQSIQRILTTPLASRVMRREFGCDLANFIDAPNHATTHAQLYAAAATALMRWEPRCRVERVQLTPPH